MGSSLYDNEWKYLFEVATLIMFADSYENTCETLLQRIKPLISYNHGVIFQASRDGGDIRLTKPITTETGNDKTDHIHFLKGNYPHWNIYLMKPTSSIFRQSDIITDAKWKTTRVYHELWEPKNNFYGLFVSLVHKDTPLAVIGLLRTHDQGDFSIRELDIFNTLKDMLEMKFYALQGNAPNVLGGTAFPERVMKALGQYNLTKRETEIVTLICQNKSSEDMCLSLFITHATLSKHLSNIYTKTGARNRTELFGLFSKIFG